MCGAHGLKPMLLVRQRANDIPILNPSSDAHQPAVPGRLAVNPLGVAIKQDFSFALIEAITASQVFLHDGLGLDNR